MKKILSCFLVSLLFGFSANCEARTYNAFILGEFNPHIGNLISKEIQSAYEKGAASKFTTIDLRTARVISSIFLDPQKEYNRYLRTQKVSPFFRAIKRHRFATSIDRLEADAIGVFIDDISFRVDEFEAIKLYLLNSMVTPFLRNNLNDRVYSDSYLFHPKSNFKNLHKLRRPFSVYISEPAEYLSKKDPEFHRSKLYRFYSLLFKRLGAENIYVFDDQMRPIRFDVAVDPIDFSKEELVKYLIPKRAIAASKATAPPKTGTDGSYVVKVFNGTATVSASLPHVKNKKVVILYDNTDIKVYSKTDPTGRIVFRIPLHQRDNSFRIIGDTGKVLKNITVKNNEVDSLIKVTLQWDTNRNDVDLHVLEPQGQNSVFARPLRSNREVYFGNMRRLGMLDIDILYGYGPENYTVNIKHKGEYKIFVKYYSAHGVTSDVNYTVIVNNRGKIKKFNGKYTRRDVSKKDFIYTITVD